MLFVLDSLRDGVAQIRGPLVPSALLACRPDINRSLRIARNPGKQRIAQQLESRPPSSPCRQFVGQANGGKGKGAKAGGGMTQQEQSQVLTDFRAYAFNILVATCIGEEGLDIPDVDLILCLDVSASPTRSVQRMGRTGRHRKGRVVYVLSAGKEEQKYARSVEVRLPCIKTKGFDQKPATVGP